MDYKCISIHMPARAKFSFKHFSRPKNIPLVINHSCLSCQNFYELEVIINVNEALVLNTVIGKIKSSQVCQLKKFRSPIINVKYLPM